MCEEEERGENKEEEEEERHVMREKVDKKHLTISMSASLHTQERSEEEN